MQKQKKRFQKRICLSLVLILSFPFSAKASEILILEPVVQGVVLGDTIEAVQDKDKLFIEAHELADIIGIKLDSGSIMRGYFIDPEEKFEINPKELSKEDVREIGENFYLSTAFYEKKFPLQIELNPFEMQLFINSDKILPIKTHSDKKRRRAGANVPEIDGFENYQFDKRLFSFPVMDVSYMKGFTKTKDSSNNFDSYQLDFGMLAFGLDTSMTVFDNKEPFRKDSARFRFLAERTFLEEPRNKLNLVQFRGGDLTGLQSNLFDNANNGRGFYFSSFKDLIMSADKTIEINGPLAAGWEVELYLNNQLISYRQSGSAGRYEFADIPVNFGLNVFSLVFYGPYGETRTEERRYYSGTSPVKKGEIGYDISAYQKNRFLVEENENLYSKTDDINFNAMFYYGVTDNLTIMGGQSRTVNHYSNSEVRDFSNIGFQAVLSGASIQYNTLYSSNNEEIGHHADIQGNIYIGNILARYEYYGDLESPVSHYNGSYLKDLMELRLSGNLYKINIPYYISYQVMNSHDGEVYNELRTRISPSFMRYYNLTIENVWQKTLYHRYNYTHLLLNAQYGKLGLNAHAQYYTHPQSQLNNFGARLDYRLDKNTYLQLGWTHYNQLKNNRHFYYLDNYTYSSGEGSIDTVNLSAGKVFGFGGLTLSLSADSKDNYAMYLTYNLSIGKIPGHDKVVVDAQTKMTNMGAVMTKVVDNDNKPIKDAKIWVTGTEKPTKTNEQGEALVTDIQPYQKASLNLVLDEIEDISLYPDDDKFKMVFRPGTIRPFKIVLYRKGAVEGQIDEARGRRYLVKLVSREYEQETFSDKEGFFILEDTAYGDYVIEVYNMDEKLVAKRAVVIDKPLVTVNEKIKMK